MLPTPKKIGLFLRLNQLQNHGFDHLLSDGFFNLGNEYYFIYVYDQMMENQLPYNVERSRSQIESYIKSEFALIKNILWNNNKDKQPPVHYHVEKSLDPRNEALTMIKELELDSCVVISREKNGVKGKFENSLGHFLASNANCNILLLQPTVKSSLCA